MKTASFWDYFEARVKQQFPDKLTELPSGADAKSIQQAEALMKIKLPSTVKEFYQRHDGSGCFCIEPVNGGGPQYFLALKKMIMTWQPMCKIGREFERDEQDFGTQDGPIKRNYWNPRWIPIAENQCGDNIFLDLDPDEGGAVGQIVDWWHETAQSKLVSSSFVGWLQDMVVAIDEGKMQIVA